MEPILEKIPESVKRRFADDYLVFLWHLKTRSMFGFEGKNVGKRKRSSKY